MRRRAVRLVAIALVLAFGCAKKKPPQAPANATQKTPDDKPKKPEPGKNVDGDKDDNGPDVKEDPCAGGQ